MCTTLDYRLKRICCINYPGIISWKEGGRGGVVFGAEESREPQGGHPRQLGKQVRSLGTDALVALEALEAQRVSGSQGKEDA